MGCNKIFDEILDKIYDTEDQIKNCKKMLEILCTNNKKLVEDNNSLHNHFSSLKQKIDNNAQDKRNINNYITIANSLKNKKIITIANAKTMTHENPLIIYGSNNKKKNIKKR